VLSSDIQKPLLLLQTGLVNMFVTEEAFVVSQIRELSGLVSMFCRVSDAQRLDWKTMADLPHPVAGYMTTSSQGMLLLIGGSYWVGDQKHWTNLVQAFDPGLNAWIEKPSLPIALSDAALAVFRKEIYILGGGSGLTISTHIFVLRDGHWRESEGAPLPEPRLYATAVSSGDYIYLVGGMSRVRDYTTVSNSFWRWRPGSKQWQILAPLP
jgi:N-acetylneuraminic acid mutarotase